MKRSNTYPEDIHNGKLGVNKRERNERGNERGIEKEDVRNAIITSYFLYCQQSM